MTFSPWTAHLAIFTDLSQGVHTVKRFKLPQLSPTNDNQRQDRYRAIYYNPTIPDYLATEKCHPHSKKNSYLGAIILSTLYTRIPPKILYDSCHYCPHLKKPRLTVGEKTLP